MKTVSVFGIYSSRISLENAIDRVKIAGFRNSDISVLMPNGDSLHAMGKRHGETTGSIIGGTLGWLAGVGALAIPGVGPFIAAGPIMASLAGAGVGGTLGGITGGLIGLGLPEYESKRYDGRICRGDILVAVHCDEADFKKRAQQILEDTGAEDISVTEIE